MKRNLINPTRLIQLFATAALLAAGCSTPTPARVDTGAIPAATFNFIPVRSNHPTFTENRQAVHGFIQEAITQNLTAKGLTRAPGPGDVTVAYLIVVADNASTSAINDYFGYGAQASDLTDKAHGFFTADDSRNYFKAGTLLIDLIDSKTQQILLRNYAIRPVLRNPMSDAQQSQIQEAVNEVLKNVRIKR